MNKKNLVYVFAIVVGLVFLANGLILAWTAPTVAPPGGTVTAPLNVGGDEQSKTGRLGISTSDADNSYGLTVGTNNTYGIKSDRYSWFGGGLNAAGWALSNDQISDDSENVIQTSDEWLRLNNSSNFSNGVYTPGRLRADGGIYVSDNERFYRSSEQVIATDGTLSVGGALTANSSIWSAGWIFANGGIRSDSSAHSGRLMLDDNVEVTDSLYVDDSLCIRGDCRTSWPSGGGTVGANTVGSLQVIDNSLTAADLAANSVGASEIAANAVGSSEVANDSLTADDLAANSVGSSELVDNVTFGTINIGGLIVGGTRTCMFFRWNTCPSGWTAFSGAAAFFTYYNNCPYTLGNRFSGSWYWCYARVCCRN